MEEIVKYIKENSIQKEDDLVFPTQDWETLKMNIQRVIKKQCHNWKSIKEYNGEYISYIILECEKCGDIKKVYT